MLHWLKEEMPDVRLSLRGDYIPPAEAAHAPRTTLSEEEFHAAARRAEAVAEGSETAGDGARNPKKALNIFSRKNG
jgi:hypothetical protein